MNKYDYDVIIIGAGIGGLVCGCYLAKAGLKTLIVEKNAKVGGYCTSFERDGILFDACVHSIGSCRENGVITNIVKDLGIEITIFKNSFSKLIISENKRLEINRDIQITIDNLCQYFPKERRSLKDFFYTIMRNPYTKLAAKLSDLTFENFFRMYTINEELNNLFSFLFFQTAGLPSDLISAFFAIILLKEYIIDGGYYPKDGMQGFSDKLRNAFMKFGGKILVDSEVTKIIVENKKAIGIELKRQKISTNIVVSNIDVIYTLKNLLCEEKCRKTLKSLSNMKQSLSCFIIYIKVNKSLHFSSSVQFVSLRKNIKQYIYDKLCKNDFNDNYLDCYFNRTGDYYKVILSLMVPFNNRLFWGEYKDILVENMIKKFISKTNLNKADIEIKEVSTPLTLYKWTYSYKGANFGWSPLVSQVFPNFKFTSDILNLHFVGHWLGMGHGISSVAYLGKHIANTILLSKS